jgi:tetratricopeptide (TPR) repeat protein
MLCAKGIPVLGSACIQPPQVWGHQSVGQRTSEQASWKVGCPHTAPMFHKLSYFAISWLLLTTLPGVGQTFEINNQGQSAPNNSGKKKSKTFHAQDSAQASEGGIGWGSGIEVARNSRAAQQALQKGDYPSAVLYATRATHAAPQNTALWFMLGYSARLAGRYQVSIDAYKRGLQNQPSSIQGLSGLAQTYAKMGRQAEARDILEKVLAANPRSVNDLQLAGELSLSTDANTALDLLKRSEALQPAARTELLIARAYQRLNQPEESKRYLDRAQSRAPGDPNVLRAVAGFYRDAKQYDLAISTLQKAISSKDPGVLSELAYTYQLAGKKKQAADTYAQAASKSPGDTGLQLSAAQASVNVGQFDQAKTFLQRAEARDPNHYRLHAIRGQIAYLQARSDDAIREYRFALDHLPEGVPEGPLYPISLHLSLYELYRATEDNAGADRELAAARTAIGRISGVEDSNQPEFLRLRASVEAASNDLPAAERDIKQANALDPTNVNIMLSYANLLAKINRKPDAYQMYTRALKLDPPNHAALTAVGYLSRDLGDQKGAEKYFVKLASLYPNNYVPYLALGDLYTSTRDFARAQANYEKAYELAPNNPLVVAGGTNSALEAHELPIAKRWLDRADANARLNQNPQVMRERERYLTWTGRYEESAALGYKVLEKLPRDAEAPVYLAYDLLFLNKYDDALAIVQKYKPILPKDKDLRLIAGYLHTHNGQHREAVADFTEALELDPKVATAYMNRGFVLNDMREAEPAAQDFRAALKLRPNYGEAHLGLAYSDLQLRRAKSALKEVDTAAKLLGESRATRLARAEAYRQQIQLRQAEGEYRAALKFAPNDVQTRLSLADTLYRLHRYDDSIEVLKTSLGLSPNDAAVYAQMARTYAQLHQRDEALRSITAAEQRGGNDSKVLMATGEALIALGDEQAAMDRYSRALDIPDSDRIGTRLALARLFAQQGRRSDAQQQVSLGFAESRVGEANPITAEHLLQAAQVLMSIQQFDLAKKYFERAQAAGAGDEAVAVGLANAYLATGETQSAGQLLHSLGNSRDNYQNYEYLIAMGNVYRQQQETVQALSAFARANRLVEGNESTERTELALAEQEGRQITNNLSVQSQFSLNPIFEDINIYTLDAKLLGVTPNLLPTPRSSIETRADARYRIHFAGWPSISGLVGERNSRGTISFPSRLLIQDRNTYDTIFNGGINPVLHLGNNTIAFNPGLQFTIRRDTISAPDMNQNLFRQFLYVYTSPFFNWLSFSASAMREAGPFTERNLHSRDAAARIDFVVGRPWGRTALITGYSTRDVLFRPLVREYYTTSMYAGLQRKFGDNVRASIFGEYLRAWRVEDNRWAIAQALRPAFELEVRAAKNWTVQASGAWSRGEGFHAYDNVNNQLLISYVRPIQRPLNDGLGDVPVTYPLRLSFGIQQQTFYNFTAGSRTKVLPVIRLTLF